VGLRVKLNHVGADDFVRLHPGQIPPPYPRELVEFWRFRDYQLPPLAGGQRDQPAGWFDRAETIYDYYAAYTAWLDSDRSAAWRDKHPRDSELAKEIEDIIYAE